MTTAFIAEPPTRSTPVSRADAGISPFGELGGFLADPLVTDVFISGHGAVWVDRGGGAERDSMTLDEQTARDLAVRLIARGGRHLDEANPCVDVRLDLPSRHAIRVHAVLPPISPTGTVLSIRFPRAELLTVDDVLSASERDQVLPLVAARTNLLITGAGGSGKTTMLGALLSTAPVNERIVLIEDVAELRTSHPHVISLEARQANLEGAGEVTLARLVRESLRMRPDRLVVGECRGAEIRELLAALNTGHDGGAGTLHANSLADVPARLEALGALAGMSDVSLARQAVSAIGAVLHLERTERGRSLSDVGTLVIAADGRLGIEAHS